MCDVCTRVYIWLTRLSEPFIPIYLRFADGFHRKRASESVSESFQSDIINDVIVSSELLETCLLFISILLVEVM